MTRDEQVIVVWNYRVVEEFLEHVDLGRYRTYAIQAEEGSGDAGRTVTLVHDVTTDLRFAEELAERFTRGQLSPIHLKDAIEDMLP